MLWTRFKINKSIEKEFAKIAKLNENPKKMYGVVFP